MLSELHSLNLDLCSKQYNKKIILHLIVVPQLSSGCQHDYSTKTSQAGCANEQSMYALMSLLCHDDLLKKARVFVSYKHFLPHSGGYCFIWSKFNWLKLQVRCDVSDTYIIELSHIFMRHQGANLGQKRHKYAT